MEKKNPRASRGSKPGRPTLLESEKISQRVIDALLSMWAIPEDEMNFTQLHRGLVRKGIVQKVEYRYKTDRILKKLCKMKLIKKIGRGRYRLNVEPDEFRIFDYLQSLRQRSESSQFQVGGSLWSLCELYFLGMPQSISKYVDVEYALEILNIRIARLFEAARVLANEVVRVGKDRKTSSKNRLLPLPPNVIRELLLELIPYYLGSRAGIDADGLSLDELSLLLPRMIQSLPHEVTSQSPTRKNVILKNFLVINKLLKTWQEEKDKLEEELDDEETATIRDFALIVIRPEYLVDESGFEKRWVKEELFEHSLKNKSPLYIASSLLLFKRENSIAVLDVYGRKYLGKQKWKETRELYEKLYASNWIGRIINDFDFYDHKEKVEAKKYIERIADKHGVKNIIEYLPFSHCSLNFILPTPAKERTLQKFFPQVPKEKIHEWLNEGAIVASQVSDEKFSDLEEKIENLEKN